MNRRLPISILAFFVFTCCWTFSSTAQTDISNYDTETIYLQTWSNRYVKDGQSYPLGLFRKKLAPEMDVSPDAVVIFRQSRKNNNIALGLFGATVGLLAGSLIADNSDVQVGLAIGALGTGITSIAFSGKSQNQLEQAIWLRNKAVLD